MTPDQVIDAVKASGLRGRGGAGFPTGLKWQFVDKKSPNPKYIVCNADESEPGTFKDHLLMERNPHLLVEGCLIGCYAIGVEGRLHLHPRRVLPPVPGAAAGHRRRPRAPGSSGTNILGTGFDCEVYLHRGAGAYEAGEETALLESLEGKRAQPRFKPPFPAVAGAVGLPDRGQQRRDAVQRAAGHDPRRRVVRRARARRRTAGPKLFCVSGHVKRPGVFEAPMKVTLRELIDDYAGGMRDGHTMKAVIPGGSSVPILLPDQIDIPASFDAIAAGRIAARLGGDHGARRHHRHGLAGREPAALLPPRVVRQVHAVPRGHRLALSAAAPDAAGRGLGQGHHAAQERRRSTSTARRCAPSATRRRRRC